MQRQLGDDRVVMPQPALTLGIEDVCREVPGAGAAAKMVNLGMQTVLPLQRSECYEAV